MMDVYEAFGLGAVNSAKVKSTNRACAAVMFEAGCGPRPMKSSSNALSLSQTADFISPFVFMPLTSIAVGQSMHVNPMAFVPQSDAGRL
jgi:hypothetical protein